MTKRALLDLLPFYKNQLTVRVLFAGLLRVRLLYFGTITIHTCKFIIFQDL